MTSFTSRLELPKLLTACSKAARASERLLGTPDGAAVPGALLKGLKRLPPDPKMRAPISVSTKAAPIIPNPTQRRICCLELFFFATVMCPPHEAYGAVPQILWFRSLLGQTAPSKSLLSSCFVRALVWCEAACRAGVR